jgi:hypothetical protein
LGFNEDNNVGRTKTINHPDWEWDFHTTKKMVMTGGWLITTRKNHGELILRWWFNRDYHGNIMGFMVTLWWLKQQQ